MQPTSAWSIGTKEDEGWEQWAGWSTQVMLQGSAGREIWLGVELRRGGAKITGWMQSGELQRRAAGNADWLARLRGKGREGWSVVPVEHSWACSESSAMTGHGMRGAVVGWYLPVQVVDEGKMNRSGVRVVAVMREGWQWAG